MIICSYAFGAFREVVKSIREWGPGMTKGWIITNRWGEKRELCRRGKANGEGIS